MSVQRVEWGGRGTCRGLSSPAGTGVAVSWLWAVVLWPCPGDRRGPGTQAPLHGVTQEGRPCSVAREAGESQLPEPQALYGAFSAGSALPGKAGSLSLPPPAPSSRSPLPLPLQPLGASDQVSPWPGGSGPSPCSGGRSSIPTPPRRLPDWGALLGEISGRTTAWEGPAPAGQSHTHTYARAGQSPGVGAGPTRSGRTPGRGSRPGPWGCECAGLGTRRLPETFSSRGGGSECGGAVVRVHLWPDIAAALGRVGQGGRPAGPSQPSLPGSPP